MGLFFSLYYHHKSTGTGKKYLPILQSVSNRKYSAIFLWLHNTAQRKMCHTASSLLLLHRRHGSGFSATKNQVTTVKLHILMYYETGNYYCVGMRIYQSPHGGHIENVGYLKNSLRPMYMSMLSLHRANICCGIKWEWNRKTDLTTDVAMAHNRIQRAKFRQTLAQ